MGTATGAAFAATGTCLHLHPRERLLVSYDVGVVREEVCASSGSVSELAAWVFEHPLTWAAFGGSSVRSRPSSLPVNGCKAVHGCGMLAAMPIQLSDRCKKLQHDCRAGAACGNMDIHTHTQAAGKVTGPSLLVRCAADAPRHAQGLGR